MSQRYTKSARITIASFEHSTILQTIDDATNEAIDETSFINDSPFCPSRFFLTSHKAKLVRQLPHGYYISTYTIIK